MLPTAVNHGHDMAGRAAHVGSADGGGRRVRLYRIAAVSVSAVDDRFTVPLYSVAEAAQHIDVPVSTFRSWTGPGRTAPRTGAEDAAGAPASRSSPRCPATPGCRCPSS